MFPWICGGRALPTCAARGKLTAAELLLMPLLRGTSSIALTVHFDYGLSPVADLLSTSQMFFGE